MTLANTPSAAHARLVALLCGVALCAMFACAGRSTLDLPPGHLTLSSASTLDFGLTACAAASPALAVTIANDEASSPLHWSAKLDGPFALDGSSSGALVAHTITEIRVHAAVPVSSIAGTPVDGTLRIENDDTSQPALVIPLRVTPEGAMLRFSSLPVDLGDAPISTTSPWVTTSIVNDGNVWALGRAVPARDQEPVVAAGRQERDPTSFRSCHHRDHLGLPTRCRQGTAMRRSGSDSPSG